MSISGESGVGIIRLFDDFCGPEIPVEGDGVYIDVNYAGIHSGPFKVTGSIHDTDSGVVSLAKSSGYVRLTSSATADGDGVAVGTEVCFSPVLNGTLVLETRVELAALTARNVFAGFCTANADEVLEPLTATTTTITKVVPSVGFLFDSQLTTNGTRWFMPYLLAADTTQTSTDVDSSQTAVAGESDILRVEIDNNGAARWYVNGVLEQSVGAGLAATPATLLAGLVGCWSTTSTVGSADVDYLLVTAGRDWTR
ncbi:hypothetical protein LCGC14_0961500 [marine sediment metagenome]|uniref:Uncharacterized protein n=1 Tax=marine sediment metagenome TaxID=412755 RepID=A0A0F9QXJ6_9ZZZZ